MRRVSGAAAAVAVSLIAPASAAAQIGRGVDVPDGAVSAITYVLGWLMGTVALLGLAALAAWFIPGDRAERVYETARRETGRAFGMGALVMIGIPITVFALSITVIGLPLALSTSFVGAALSTAGYVTAGWLLGRAISDRRARPVDARGRVLWTVLGVGLLRVVALVPVLDALVLAMACAAGVGALLATYAPPLAAGRTTHRVSRDRDGAVELPMVRVFDAREA